MLHIWDYFRFVRGGPDDSVLTTQDDQMQDHIHIDEGHDHTDSGHSHDDAGHTHSDGGHAHNYDDYGLYNEGTCLFAVYS